MSVVGFTCAVESLVTALGVGLAAMVSVKCGSAEAEYC